MLKAGAAEVEITPPAGTPITGFVLRDPVSVGVHDPLCAGAIFMENGETRVLILSCDVLGFTRSFVEQLRLEISRKLLLSGARIMICATHNHAGPATMQLENCGSVARRWMSTLRSKLVELACRATENLQPVTSSYGEITVSGLTWNRRKSSGPVDDTLHLLRFDSQNGKPLASLVSFACHPICSGYYNRRISADFPGVIRKILREDTGSSVLFVNGACADINPSFMQSVPDQECFEGVRKTGERLATAAKEVWPKLQPVEIPSLRVRRRVLGLPLLAPPSISQLQQTLKQPDLALSPPEQMAMKQWAEKMLRAHQRGDMRRQVLAEVQVFHLGNLRLIGISSEIFAEHGLKIKQIQGGGTIVFGYTNGNIGYVPTREAYAAGGYEVESAYKYYGCPAALAPEAEEMLLQAAVELSRR